MRAIVAKIANLPESQRNTAVQQIIVLTGLRRLGDIARGEIEKMPLVIDILENTIIGPAIRKGLEEGRREGIQEGHPKALWTYPPVGPRKAIHPLHCRNRNSRAG